MIDTHCHLAGEEFVADLAAVVARAQQAGVRDAICILASEDLDELARAGDVRRAWPSVRFATGTHPHAAGTFEGRAHESAAATAHAISVTDGVCAVGEIGLDYHYDLAPKQAQHEVFAAQVELAVSKDLPVVIHTREAMDDTVAILKSAGQGKVRGVIHCFTGSVDDARVALELGFYVSFSGILTFPRGVNVREAAAIVPADRMLVETDAPFLRLVPHRGKRNEPAWVTETLAALATIKGMSVADAADAVAENAARLF